MRKNKGFTLIELLIGAAVSALIFLTAGSLISLIFRTDVKTQRVENLEQTKNDLVVQISDSVRWATAVEVVGSELKADTDTYSLVNGKLLKNGEAITPNNVKITKFSITDLSLDKTTLKSLEIKIDMESSSTATSKDSLNFVVSQRKKVIGA